MNTGQRNPDNDDPTVPAKLDSMNITRAMIRVRRVGRVATEAGTGYGEALNTNQAFVENEATRFKTLLFHFEFSSEW